MTARAGVRPVVRAAAPLTADALAPLADARPFLALFDIDGTLAPLAPRPQDAAVPLAARRALARLGALPGVSVGLVTGRSADDGTRLVDVPGLWVVGNHGVETCDPDGTRHLAPPVLPFAEPLARAADALSAIAAGVPGALLEDKRWSLSLHYRLVPDSEVPALQAAAERVAEAEGLRVTRGKAVHELRAPVDVDKGTAVVALARRLGAVPDGAVLFIGDDVTDEDAFARLTALSARAVTIRVGPPEVDTGAAWRVDGPPAVHTLLDDLIALRYAGATG